jgi:capsular exopolysaccharide synthesis family protein
MILAAAFIAENLEDRIRDQRDLQQHFQLPFLGPVPIWREGESRLINLDRPRTIIASVHEVLRNNINYALPPGAPKVLLVASSVQGEGKSTIAANLAISYCLDGNNVLLIDTDLRRPRAHRLFESLCPQAGSSPGLTGYLSGQSKLEEILFQASVPGLSIISAGKGAINPSKLLGSDEMRHLLAELTQSFDAIILDAPAVLPVVDSTVVSSLASGVLLVVSSKRARVEQVATAVSRLEHVKAPLVGMVLNRQPGGSRGYYHYYGSRYGYGYGYGYGYSYHEGEGRKH